MHKKSSKKKKSLKAQVKEAASTVPATALSAYGALTVKELEHRYSSSISSNRTEEEQKRSDCQFMDEIKNGCKGVTNYKEFENWMKGVFKRNPEFALLHQAIYQKCLKEVKARA